MPFIHLNVSRPMNAEETEKARDAIAANVSILPGKNRGNTMIRIDSGCTLTMGDAGEACAFMEVRLAGPSPEEAKKEFVAKAAEALTAITGIPGSRMYVNIIELDHWGVGGNFR